MDYRELKTDRRAEILRERLAQLEEHHYKLSIDVSDAEAVADTTTLESARERMTVVETQIANASALLDALGPKKGKRSGRNG